MAGNDPKENTRAVKPEVCDGPIYEPNRWYLSLVLRRRFHCSKQTWARWVAAGLTVHSSGSKTERCFTDENLDRILRLSEAELPPAYRSPYAERNQQRRRRNRKE
jgi:hypothetical protein